LLYPPPQLLQHAGHGRKIAKAPLPVAPKPVKNGKSPMLTGNA
jgi:hypothetical protein